MAYKALYRTYRPQSFEEVAGQQHIIRTLKNALANNKIAHAYLFCGPRGTGKTTMAKLFAKALNCEEGVGHQCNKCSNCVEITEGSHPDVIEIDAASNNGVEQVRDLIDKVNYLPLKGKYKVYIIDEVHMMTANAFNALLKTLEEPPAHVIFILATTEPHNIIPTILSRCQRYDFTKVSDADIEQRIITILGKEGIEYDKDAVKAIISLADGGMRDALSILDQILAYSNNTLSVSDVYSIFGLVSVKDKIEFLRDIYAQNVTKTLERIKNYSEGGIDILRLTQDCLEILKDVLIYKKTGEATELSILNESNAEQLSSTIQISVLHQMIGTFLKLQLDFKSASNTKTLFEVAVLKLLTSGDVALEQPKVAIQKAETPVVKEEPKTEPAKQPEPDKQPETITVKEEPVLEKEKAIKTNDELAPVVQDETKAPDWLIDDDSEKKELNDDGDRYELSDETMMKLMVIGDKELRKSITNRWDELNSYLGHPTYGDVVALLKDGQPFIATKNVLVLSYDFEKLASKANVKTNSKKISEIIQKMIGKDMFIYAISRSESVRYVAAYQNLRQISRLPSPASINISLEDLRK